MSGGRRRRKASQRRNNTAAAVEFWGRDHTYEEPEPIAVSELPSAMVRSLGRLPIHANHEAAEATFEVIYTRAAMLATALADSVGLLDHFDDE